MIHLSKIQRIMERKDKDGKPVPFSLKYVKKSTGEIIFIQGAVLTSAYYAGTVNIMITESMETRTLILPLIIEFNNNPVYL